MLLMKSVKMACVHPAALQLFQKVVESILGSGLEGSATGEEDVMDTQTGSGGAEVVQGGDPVVQSDLDWPREGGGSMALRCATERALVC